jgi:hypothetical protein
MLNLEKIKIDYCMDELKKGYERMYSDMEKHYGNIVVWTTHLALEHIANSDALYHDVEHTVLVALAGQSILEGKHLAEGGVRPKDWAHYMVALLCHDIGYVKGICRLDSDGTVATGIGDETVQVAIGSTDAVMAPYHIDRSKLFVRERFGKGMLMEDIIDAEKLAEFIEMTRFPVPDDDWYKETTSYRGLFRAADFIGQLGDPYRLQKCTALFYEFEEIGLNDELGYKNPGDLRENNAKFYWDVVNPYVQDSLRYLRVTQDGKQWITNLHANVFGQHMDVIFGRTKARPYEC